MTREIEYDERNILRMRERPLFELGRVLSTPGALAAVGVAEMNTAMARHMTGDWGELNDEDREANDSAVKRGSRVLSAYNAANGVRFWIITEWDRSATTFLLPSEY